MTMTVIGRVAGKLRGASPDTFPWVAPTWPGAVPRPAPERELGVDYPTDWTRKYPARLLRAVVLDNLTRPAINVLASPQVRGDEVLETLDPPVIFVANHTSHVDTPLLLSVLPARFRHKMVVAAAADHFFDRRWKAHLWALTLAAIPIERKRVNRRSAQVAGALINDGWNLLIYPEGSRSPDGWFQDFRGGAAYLATRTGRPVVPVHMEGTGRILPKGGERLRRSRTKVTFGSPLSPIGDEDARSLEARIETTLATMADEARTDWWTARRRAARGTTPSPRGPDASPWRRAWALGPPPHDADEADPGRWALSDTS